MLNGPWSSLRARLQPCRRLWVAGATILALLSAPAGALAAYACNAAVTSVNTFYNPSGSTLVTSAGFTISCNRLASDPASVSWKLWADNGVNAQGSTRRVQFSGTYYTYDLYTSPGLGNNTQWTTGPNLKEFSGTLNFTGGSLTAATSGLMYYLQVAAPQAAGPAGVYTDTLTSTLTYGPTNATSIGAFGINLTTVTNCSLVAPTSLSFGYTSFQATAAAPSANFTVNCTTGLPYTLTLDNTGPITDNAVNLTYSLGLSAAGGTGSGTNQTYSVNGNMAAGQSGNCAAASCTNAAATNKTRTLTVTY